MPVRFDDANNLEYYRGNPGSEYLMEAAQPGSFGQAATILASVTQPAGRVELDGDTDADDETTILASFTQPANWFDFNDDADADDAKSNADDVSADADDAKSNSDDAGADSDDAGPNLFGAGPDSDNATPDSDNATPDSDNAAPDVYDDAAPNLDEEPGSVDVGVTSWENSAYLTWYEFFDDPMLVSLINQALVGNQELKMLGEEIRIAGFEVMARRGAYLPFVTVGGGAGIDKPGQYTRMGAVEDQLDIRPGKGFPEPLPDFLAAANVSWQVDIWRQLRNARDAAILHYLGTQEGQTYVVTRLAAEIAENYYELMALDNRLEILDQTIQIQEQSRKVAELNKAAGRGTDLAVQRFRAEVRKNQSEKLIVHQRIIAVENRINFLLGRYPQHVARDSSGYLNLRLHALNAGVPSQLLQNRPDIRQAERELASAGLGVQVARARFYPSLFLTGGVGYQAFNPKYLFTTPESLIYNVAGDIVAPLINKKAIRADYLSANARQLRSLYNYQRTILNAFTEVINRMAKVENYAQSIEVKRQQVAALEASVDVATKLFQAARAEYVDVLLAQRDLMEARTVLVETKQQQLSAIINAYQALGGGGTQVYNQY